MKKCTVCNNEKDLKNYSKDKYRKDGYDATCKNCKKIQRKERTKKRKDVEIPSLKKCSSCQEILSNENYHKKPGSLDGLHTECKKCKKEKRLEIKTIKFKLFKFFCKKCVFIIMSDIFKLRESP